MRSAVLAGVIYFAIVFVIAFAFGAVRTLWLAPAIGETWAVACEIPLLVLAMIFAAPWALRRLSQPRSIPTLIAVGLIAFVLMQVAEIGFDLAMGRSLSSQIAYLSTAPGRIYIAGLVLFVVMPLLIDRFGLSKQIGADR